jgi:hypothetical protein
MNNTTFSEVNTTETPSTTTVVLKDTTAGERKFSFIESLAIEREAWENTVYRTSNQHLYGLLGKCYGKYVAMTKDTVVAKEMRLELETYINLKGYTFSKTSHTLTKIVKCVFGGDRRRNSTYSIVLRAAFDKKIKEEDIAKFIEQEGGVQEIRLTKCNALSTKDKAQIAKSTVVEQVLATVASEDLAKQLDAAKVGQQVVIVATQQANGSVTLNAVTYSEGAVNAALSSYYALNKESIKEKNAGREKASNDSKLNDAIGNAA